MVWASHEVSKHRPSGVAPGPSGAALALMIEGLVASELVQQWGPSDGPSG